MPTIDHIEQINSITCLARLLFSLFIPSLRNQRDLRETNTFQEFHTMQIKRNEAVKSDHSSGLVIRYTSAY